MSAEFQLTYLLNEYVSAGQLYLRRRYFWGGALKFVGVLGAIIFIILASAQVIEDGWNASQLAVTALKSLLAGLVGFGVLYLYLLWDFPRCPKRSFDQLDRNGKVARYRFDESEIEVSDEFNFAKFRWPEMVRWTENDKLILLYRTDEMFFYVPKHQVDTATIDALKAHLTTASVTRI